MSYLNDSATKHGLKGLGYVTNLSTCVKELNEFLPKGSPLSFDDITGIVDASAHVYLNKYGKPSDKSGNPIPRENASYLYFETGLQNSEGADIIGWFSRVNKKGFLQGVTWGTKEQLETQIRRCNMFHIDELCFEKWPNIQALLDYLAANLIPETWSDKNKATQSSSHYPTARPLPGCPSHRRKAR
jgi:hypothetical protein